MRLNRTALLVALSPLLVLAACGGGGGGDEAATTTTRAAPTSTAATLPPGASPLTGMPLPPDAQRRPALVVKIDNAPKARPQAGLNNADIVIEEKVEDGVTRFFTIFHGQSADPVGPVRSARSTDVHLVGQLNKPLFAFSGANSLYLKLVRESALVDVGYDRFPGSYRRERARPAPYNLMSSTGALWAHTPPGSGPPPPQLTFAATEPERPGAKPGRELHIEFRGKNITTIVDWRWDAAAREYRRSTDNQPHTDAAGAPVSAKNVIVQVVNYKDTGLRDTSGSPVPEAELVGKGEAWIFTGGVAVQGTWEKPDAATPTRFRDASGNAVAMTPGRTWIELPPPGATRGP